MSSLHMNIVLFSAGTIPNKAAALKNRHHKIHATPPAVSCPSDKMVDGSSTLVKDVRPHITSFSPSMWGDMFSSSSFDDQVQEKYNEEIEVLKKEARSMLMAATCTKLMILIDKLERLGLAYHFETEIEEKLKQVYDSVEKEQDYDLFTTALRFRLLRQHQHRVSCNALGKFVNKDNKLKEHLCSDIEGLLSLYEAVHVRIHDEDILDEAFVFTANQLSSILPELESPIKDRVQHALDYPLHKSLMTLNMRSYISIYEKEDSRDELLLRLAKLNFNFVQNIYRNELFEITRWWNNSNLKSKVTHFRDRLVECYIWAMAYHSEPQYTCLRIMITKIFMMGAVMDDTYDNYATLEEMELLTQALNSWNLSETELLPDYIKMIYEFIMSVSEELEREAEKHEKLFAIPYYIQEMKRAGRGYTEEQEWIMKRRRMPSFEEYMIHSRITAFMYITLTSAVIEIKATTKETIDWLLTPPNILKGAADLGRLLDDMASYERESKEGEMITGIDIYMKDKGGVSKQEALSAFAELAEEEWKNLSAEWVNSTTISVPKEMVVLFLNIARTVQMTYRNGQDGFSHPENNLGPLISALLVDPILI